MFLITKNVLNIVKNPCRLFADHTKKVESVAYQEKLELANEDDIRASTNVLRGDSDEECEDPEMSAYVFLIFFSPPC